VLNLADKKNQEKCFIGCTSRRISVDPSSMAPCPGAKKPQRVQFKAWFPKGNDLLIGGDWNMAGL